MSCSFPLFGIQYHARETFRHSGLGTVVKQNLVLTVNDEDIRVIVQL